MHQIQEVMVFWIWEYWWMQLEETPFLSSYLVMEVRMSTNQASVPLLRRQDTTRAQRQPRTPTSMASRFSCTVFLWVLMQVLILNQKLSFWAKGLLERKVRELLATFLRVGTRVLEVRYQGLVGDLRRMCQSLVFWLACSLEEGALRRFSRERQVVDSLEDVIDCPLLFRFVEELLSLALRSRSPASGNLYSKRSTQSILRNWSFTSILRISFSNDECTVLGICRSCESKIWISLAIEFDWKGHSPTSISYSTTPNDQMSAFIVYVSPFRTSGAMQMGDPSMVCTMSSELFKVLQKPKSAILMIPLFSRILPGFRSLCMMWYLVRVLKAFKICQKQITA